MNIAFFVHQVDSIGGAEVGSRRLSGWLAARGHRVTLISTQALSQWRARGGRIFAREDGMNVVRFPVWQRSTRTYEMMLALQAKLVLPILLKNCDVLHLRKLDANAITLGRVAQRAGAKTLCVPMASGPYGDAATFPSDVPHDPFVFSRVSALTEAIRQEVIEWGIPDENVSIIPNGVDATVYQPSPGSHADGKSVIFVGQFRREKRVDLLLKAWKAVQADIPDAEFTLVGGGSAYQSFVDLASEQNVRAKFVPNLPSAQVASMLQQHGIFVLPGVSEGMSNALLEAMAVGLAPVVSDTPGNRALIEPEINGLCYHADSWEALAETLRRLLRDASLRARLGTAARKTVLEHYTLDAVAAQYEALYQRMIAM